MTSPLTKFAFLSCKTNKFHVAVGLYSNRLQKTSEFSLYDAHHTVSLYDALIYVTKFLH